MTVLAFSAVPVAIDDEDLGQQITLLAGQINAANHRLLKLIAEFDTRKGWAADGTIPSCAFWLNWKCGIATSAAREKVRVAHALEVLPQIDAAFAAGEVSYSKVRAMTRVATTENEDYLLMIARHGTASHMEKLVRKYKSVQPKSGDNPEAEQAQARQLSYYQDDDGMWVIHARLPAEEGSLVVKAIEAVVRQAQEECQHKIQQEVESANSDPVLEEVSAETSAKDFQKDVPGPFQQLMAQSRADALITVAEHFLATSANKPEFAGLKGSERCQIMLHVDINTLRQHVAGPGHAPSLCNFDDRHWLSAKTARRLSCDASLVTVLEDEQGRVLNVGRRSRTIPTAIERALKLRDATCRFPGCCESRYTDAHHIIHWADGGETSLDNLITLCRHHHRCLHQGYFSIEAAHYGGANQWLFTTATGKTIETAIFPQFSRVSAETSAKALWDIAPEVTADTGRPQWQGESCDYGMAVEGLLRREEPHSIPME